MANRTPGAMPPLDPSSIVAELLRRIEALEGRLAQLESRAGQQLPGDFRFAPSEDGASVEIRRVSTGGSTPIAGPL